MIYLALPIAAGTGFGRTGIFNFGLDDGGTTAVGLDPVWIILDIPARDEDMFEKLLGDEEGESKVGNTVGSKVGVGSALFSYLDQSLAGLVLEPEV